MIELINRLIFNLGGSREDYDSSEQIGNDVWLVHITLTVFSADLPQGLTIPCSSQFVVCNVLALRSGE